VSVTCLHESQSSPFSESCYDCILPIAPSVLLLRHTHCTLPALLLYHFRNMYGNGKSYLFPVFCWLFLY